MDVYALSPAYVSPNILHGFWNLMLLQNHLITAVGSSGSGVTVPESGVIVVGGGIVEVTTMRRRGRRCPHWERQRLEWDFVLFVCLRQLM